MKVLHICNDYSYSKVYMNLYSNLDKIGIEQYIYHPLRARKNVDKNRFEFSVQTSRIFYSNFLIQSHHRVFFGLKSKAIFKDILKLPNLDSINLCYPTTLFSDGVIAFKLFKKFNIPYIVAVRNTDVNLFLKFRPDLIPLAHKILKNAKKIIFISEGLKNKFYSHRFIRQRKHNYLEKTEVVSNGIDDVWLDNRLMRGKFAPKNLNFLFVGRFDSNKNIVNIIKALRYLRNSYPTIKLNLVGGEGNKDHAVKSLISENSEWINFHGYVSDKKILLSIYRQNSFFAMPSIYETFGLVFIEALSQGLPVLYTKDQGIDGLFDEKIGNSTYPDLNSIKENLKTLIEKDSFDFGDIDFNQYKWSLIAQRYQVMFINVLR